MLAVLDASVPQLLASEISTFFIQFSEDICIIGRFLLAIALRASFSCIVCFRCLSRIRQVDALQFSSLHSRRRDQEGRQRVVRVHCIAFILVASASTARLWLHPSTCLRRSLPLRLRCILFN